MNRETRRIFRRLSSDTSAILGFALLIFFVIVAILAPFIASPPPGRDPYIMPIVTWSSNPLPPSPEHPFGVAGKRDIFYGVVWGTRTAFRVGIIVTLISTALGLLIGSVAGYFGKLWYEILMRITDIFMAIPFLVAAMVLTTILGTG
ncbi:ABC transporter permease, partial [Candidatus Sordicultor fermentans]|uniref:ABC transporter permease n=1 Tax=Candidatus Sordicultor fermentans TaxID=1953203 RepID=UPI00169DAADD|nr:ABC transporter permease [Candidatus Atribacteria bacterium]